MDVLLALAHVPSRRTFTLSLLAALSLSALALIAAPAASAAAFTARLAYGTPTITDGAPGTLIEATDPPPSGEGLYYRAQLDPTRVYRVTLQGARINGEHFNLRISRGTKRTWHAAPDGVETYRIENTRDLEFLLYRTVPSKYRVHVLRIDDCTASCTTDGGLKDQVLSDTPGLSAAVQAGDRQAAARLILGWVAPRVTFARGGATQPMDSYFRTASELYYDYFAVNRGGVFCGGAADFYRKVLALFDVPSSAVLFGDDSGDLRHVTVIVPFPDGEGTTQYRIFDPTFNLDLVLPASGHTPTVAEFFELWRAGMMDRVEYRTQSLAERRIISDRQPDGGYSAAPCASQPGSTACSFTSWLNGNAAVLANRGFETGAGAYPHLLGLGTLFPGGVFAIPADFENMRARFKDQVLNHSNEHVALLPVPPFLNRPSTIDGNLTVGSQLTAKPGWTPRTKVTSETFQWSRCNADGHGCQIIAGARSRTYAVGESDRGRRMRVSFYASNEFGQSAGATAVTDGAVP